MQIKETSEDPRLRSLSKPIDLTSETKQAEELQPVERTRPTDDGGEFQVRVRGERRKGERRKKRRTVLLDTRSPHERRVRVRRAEDLEAETTDTAAQGAIGIDETC